MKTIKEGDTFKCGGCGKEWTLWLSVQLNVEKTQTCGQREVINGQFTGNWINGCGHGNRLSVVGANA